MNKKKFWYYIKNYKFNSLFIKNIIFMVIVLTVIFVALLMCFYEFSKNTSYNQFSTYNENILRSSKSIIDSIIREVEIIETSISQQDDIRIHTMFPESTEYIEYNNSRVTSIYNYIKKLQITSMYIDSIYIYTESNNTILTTSGYMDFEKFDDINWFESYKNGEKIMVRKKNNKYPYCFTIMSDIMLSQDKSGGVVVVNINIENIQKALNDTKSDNTNEIFITDEKNQVLFSRNLNYIMKNIPFELNYPNKKSYQTATWNNKQHIVHTEKSKYYDFSYISMLDVEQYNIEINKIGEITIYIGIILILLGSLISAFFSFHSYAPIKNIMKLFDIDVKKDDKSNETTFIVNNIMAVMNSNTNLKQELQERMELLNKFQISAFQAQINPHFLYNSLDVINWKSVELFKGRNEVSEMLANLSKLFRKVVQMDNFIISLKEELEFLEIYLNIINYRFGDRLIFQFDISDNLKEYNVLKLSLQPIVENAVEHGVKGKKNGACIKISGQEYDEYIVLSVEDNGKGISSETVDKLNNSFIRDDAKISNDGVGLINLNRRIKLVYGENYGVVVESEIGVRTIVKIKIPKHKNI